MSKMLSIITPVFNAGKTLAQAIDSIFYQNISIPFEVVIVDDGSTDDSFTVIKNLGKKYGNVRYFSHERNMGGGVARNTAVSNSKGDLIFCLDSDDVLGENMLQPMIDLLDQKKCDGVGIHLSKKFIGTNLDRIAFTTTFGYAGKKVPFESLFENSTCSLYSTFLITKKAFMICGGYPEDNGFDTQAMAFRFLANGLTAYTSPGATYLHRVNHSRSYYIREQEAGQTSENWMKIYEEFLYLFSPHLQRELLKLNLQDGNNLPATLVNSEKNRFSPGYKKFLVPKAKDAYVKQLNTKKHLNPLENYWLGVYNKEQGYVEKALKSFSSSWKMGLRERRVAQQIFRCLEDVSDLPVEELDRVIDLQPTTTHSQHIRLKMIRIINDSARLIRRFI